MMSLVQDALRRNDMPAAMALAEQALAQGHEDPLLLILAGQARLGRNQLDAAFAAFSRALTLVPGHVDALNGIGICHALAGHSAEAIAAFDAAVAAAPQAIHLRLHRAQALEEAGRLRDARADLETILATEPDNLAALERIANLAARRGDMAAARGYAARALKLAPSSAAAIALATAELADGKFERVHTLMTPIANDPRLDAVSRSLAQGLIGDAFDGENRTADAFAAYTAARRSLAGQQPPSESAIERLGMLAAYFRHADPAPWRARADAAGLVKTHVFLVGFPRSGTTLLEQALAAHPDIRTMEEIDCLGDVAGEYFYAEGGMARFAALDEIELDRLRAAYWKRVTASGTAFDRAVFVDKLPLNSVHLGLIARLFPSAHILFALRDPRDVIFSCFRRRLMMTKVAELSRIDGAAAFYDAVMTLAMLCRDLLQLPTLDLRHEDMLADFDGEMRRVCGFLGIEFDASMRDFATLSRHRDVKTPSAAQLLRGLNKDGAGQWRRYRDQLAPVLPVLAPWVARFGYED
jgi:tetratricopeptide (TPR) repeat protein